MATSASTDDRDCEPDLDEQGKITISRLIEELRKGSDEMSQRTDELSMRGNKECQTNQLWVPEFLRRPLTSLSSLLSKSFSIDPKEPEDSQDSSEEQPIISSQTHHTRSSPLLTTTLASGGMCQDCSAHQSQRSAHWTQTDPTFSRGNKTITYSFQSPPGRYECSVSGLRWVCQGEVHFSYRFSSWEPYRQTLKTMMYTPVGPLLDVTVTAGQLEEVDLPHFACLGDPSLVDQIKVVHIEEDGNISIEPMCDLAPFHVKLLHPTFSAKGILLRTGLPLKVHCNLLLYQAPRALLMIHAYWIPCDPSIEQAVQKQEKLYGNRRIPKPKPERSFKMKDFFSLRTSCSSEVFPERIKLRYPKDTPNYFEVYIREAHFDFGIDLLSKDQVTWSLKIREAEYRENILQEEHLADRHRVALIQRVSESQQLMDQLLERKLISSEAYNVIRAKSTPQDQMRALYTGPLNAGGARSKDAFYKILKRLEPNLIKDLEGE